MLKLQKSLKKMETFFKRHAAWNAVAHFMIGIGVGFLLSHPTGGIHPVRWGIAFVIVGTLIHLKAMFE